MTSANKISYVPIDAASAEIRAQGRDFSSHADAYIAALTDGRAHLKRDASGQMRVVEDGKVLYAASSPLLRDKAAKDDVVAQVAMNLSSHEFRYSTLKVERDADGKIMKIDDYSDQGLIAYWNRRIGRRPGPANTQQKPKQEHQGVAPAALQSQKKHDAARAKFPRP